MSNSTQAATNAAKNALRISKRIVISYVLDWIVIIGIAAVGVAFNQIDRSNYRPFVLQDPSLAYPYKADTVTAAVLIIVALLAPAVIIAIISLILVPGAGAPRGTPQSLIWRRKFWELNTGWMGLALSCATAFMMTEGLKDLAGKPRPHTLAVCNPDLDRISENKVGGLGTELGGAIPIMVDHTICTITDPHVLRNTFASWPSGHSSFSFAGLLYLSFFLSAKLAVSIPYLSPSSWRDQQSHPTATFPSSNTKRATISNYPTRNQNAAPPVIFLLITIVPTLAALFIAVSRWFDFHHHGFDIISGSLIGILTSWFSFRLYHMPVRRGAGWSWGARTRDRALWNGVGRETWVGAEGWEAAKYDRRNVNLDVERDGSSSNRDEKGSGAVSADSAGGETLATGVTGPGVTGANEGDGGARGYGDLAYNQEGHRSVVNDGKVGQAV